VSGYCGQRGHNFQAQTGEKVLLHESMEGSYIRRIKVSDPVVPRSKAWVDCFSLAVTGRGGWVESRRVHGFLSVVSVVCCQVGGLCDGIITRPEESYRLWRV
jgi:hypothetical protein